ncbi:MAG: four helix bundle protein [bacterium]
MKCGVEGLKVFELAYDGAMQIFVSSKSFPVEEKYALTDQIRRSSRSVCANTAEAYRKRRYLKHYLSKLTDADGEASETVVWLRFARDCGYITIETFECLYSRYGEVGKLFGYMMDNPRKFGVLCLDNV